MIQIWVLICAYSASCSGTLFGKWDNIQERGSWMAKRTAALAFSIQSPVIVPSGFVPCDTFARFFGSAFVAGAMYKIIKILYRFYLLKKYQTNGNFIRFFAFHRCSGGSFPSGAVHWESAPTVQSHSFACSFPIGNRDIVVLLSIYIFVLLSHLGIFVLSDSLCFLNPLSFLHLYILHIHYTVIIYPFWSSSCPTPKACPGARLTQRTKLHCHTGVSLNCHASSSVKAHSSRMQAWNASRL